MSNVLLTKKNNDNNHRGVSTLLYSCQQGDVETVRRILRAQPNAYLERDRTGKSALHYCCSSDHQKTAAQAADVLLMAAPDLIESRDEDGFTPLHLAVIAGNMPLITFLLANGADVNAVDNEKHTVVHWATVCGETVALQSVLAAGSPVSTPDVHGGYPLHYAAQMCGGDKDSALGLQVLNVLLAHEDVSVNVEDGEGRQPLLWAASAGSAKALLSLIRAGTAAESHDRDGLTALHCAASRGHTDCIDTLLTLCGAYPDVIDTNGCTALHYAVTLGHADATALLLAHSSDSNRQDRKGRTPAHCGCAKGQFETVKMLGGHGANLWLRNARGDLPLHEAAASGRRDLVKWLLESRPSQVNARNNDGRCPLHLAALNDNTDMCKILLDAGAQINPVLRTSKNTLMTPLDCAFQRGFRTTAKYLQLHGGIPANRLVEQSSSQNLLKDSSAGSLHIRDDVTLLGGSSSESEKEEVVPREKIKKKSVYKRKPQYKHDKKRELVSVNEHENNKDKISDKFLENENEGKVHPKGDILIYTNEVNINSDVNGNLKINRNGEVDELLQLTKDLTKELTETKKELDNSLNKRPKSAKRARMKSKTKDSLDKTKLNKKMSVINSEDQIEVQMSSTQQSARSNTSLEDNGVHKELIVEASVHVPSINTKNEIMAIIPVENDNLETEKQSLAKVQLSETQNEGVTLVSKDLSKIDEENSVKIDANEFKNDQKTILDNNIDTEIQPSENQTKENIENNNVEATVTETTIPVVNISHFKEMEITNSEKSSENETLEIQNTAEKIEETPELSESKINENNLIENVAVEDIKNCDVVDEENDTKSSEKSNELEFTNQDDQRTNYEADKIQEEIKVNVDNSVLENNLETEVDSKSEPTKTAEVLKLTDDKIISEATEQIASLQSTEGENELPSKDSVPKTAPKIVPKKTKSKKISPPKTDSSTPSETTRQTTKKVKTQLSTSTGIKAKSPARKRQNSESTVKHQEVKKTVVVSLSKPVANQLESSIDTRSSDISEEDSPPSSSSSLDIINKTHRSFQVLNDEEARELLSAKREQRQPSVKRQRSRSEEAFDASGKSINDHERLLRRSKIPTPIMTTKVIPYRKDDLSFLGPKMPSLPNIYHHSGEIKHPPRSVSNSSVPIITSVYSDNDGESLSELEEQISSATRKKRLLKKRSKNRESKSAGSDYESSNVIDSGFEPSPRSSRIPKWRNISERGVNMTSVTQTIQNNIRRYHLERKIFQHLLDLKRLQIRAGQHNEPVLVKRAIDAYHRSCASTVGAGRYISEDFSFKSFEHFLYNSLRKIQKDGGDYLSGLPETAKNPLLCTKLTHKCDHATHAYTGVPCAAYLPKMDHHTIPKIGFDCKPSGFLPKITSKNAVTLELCHGNDKQVISLPAERLDQNKRYYVTFTVKGNENSSNEENTLIDTSVLGHSHPKSD